MASKVDLFKTVLSGVRFICFRNPFSEGVENVSLKPRSHGGLTSSCIRDIFNREQGRIQGIVQAFLLLLVSYLRLDQWEDDQDR